ncbi:MAG: hypothetical protein IJ007_04950 [Oscillospiraceae bacterium]|nr:hypothetical protein [Oscillospiraceae bacterium]
MLITRDNIEEIFPYERRITVPRGEMAVTFLLHGGIIFIGQLLNYNVVSLIAIWIFILELYYVVTVLFKSWCRVGYSKALFWILFAVYFCLSGFGAALLRDCLLGLL